MVHYTMKMQRDSFIETLSNDMILNAYPNGKIVKWDQIAAGKKAFKKYWNYLIVRIGFNLLLPLIMLCFDIILPIKYLLACFSRRKNKQTFKRMFVGHDRRLYTITERIGLPKNDDMWLRLMSDTYAIPNDKQKADVLDFVTPSEIIKSAIQSVIIHINAMRIFGYNIYFLSYKAFEWCITDYALRNIPENVELVYSYICDRFAIMIDKLPHQQKTLIQHGTMHFGNKTVEIPYLEFHTERGFYIWNSLYKSSPSTVYCYTEIDEWALSNSVIANKSKFIHIGYGFVPAFKPEKKSVLIVSNYYIFARREEYIIKQLQDLDIEIYLKNHPSHSNSLYNDMKSKYRFNFISGLDTSLPAVDMLISYDSTLAYEYASIGIKVLYYGHFDLDNIKNIVSEKLSLDN